LGTRRKGPENRRGMIEHLAAGRVPTDRSLGGHQASGPRRRPSATRQSMAKEIATEMMNETREGFAEGL